MKYSISIIASFVLGVLFYKGLKFTYSSPQETNLSSLSADEIKDTTNSRNLFDAVFYYKANLIQGEKEAQIFPYRINEVFFNNQDSYLKVTDLYKASFQESNARFQIASSYNDSLDMARREGQNFTLSEKLLYLSLMGSRLSQGYSAKTINEFNMQKIFENSIHGEKQGGICGDIHSYLSAHAKALGFDGIGLHSGIWQKDAKGKNGGGHFIYHFRDPKSGVFFIQNYSQIVNTGQTTLQGAVDTSTRILGPISGVSQIESSSQAHKYHAYLPQTSRWVRDNIKGMTEIKEDDPVLKMTLSNEGSTVGIQFTKSVGDEKVRGFLIHSDFVTTEGKFEMSGVGLATQRKISQQLTNSIINEYGTMTNFNIGLMQVGAPSYDEYGNPMNKSRSVLFMGMKVQGYARINKSTGRVELEAFSNDYGLDDRAGSLDTRIRVGFEQRGGDSNWKADFEREFEGSRNNQASRDFHAQVHYDKVSLIYDNTGKEARAVLVLNTEYYIFEGIENIAATAVRQIVKASFPTAQFGTISFALDASQFVNNPSKDLYYDHPFSSCFKVGLEKAIAKFVSVGGQVEYGKGKPYWSMDSNAFPRVNRSGKLSGFVWLHIKLM